MSNQKNMFPERNTNKHREIFSVKSIKERTYQTLNLSDEYRSLLGDPEARFIMMCYGTSGRGKSVFALRLANYFAKEFGWKALYNSHEEKVNQTIQDRINKFNITAERLYFGNALPFDVMCEKIKKNHYRLLVIDSVQYMQFTVQQLKELREMFPRRHFGIVLVSFGTSPGKTRNADDLLHTSDIKAYFRNGKLQVVSRYLDKPTSKTLFKAQELAASPELEFEAASKNGREA